MCLLKISQGFSEYFELGKFSVNFQIDQYIFQDFNQADEGMKESQISISCDKFEIDYEFSVPCLLFRLRVKCEAT